MGVLRGTARPTRPTRQAEPGRAIRVEPGRAGPSLAEPSWAGPRAGADPGLDRVAHLLPCRPQGKIAIGQGAYRNKGALSPIYVVFSRKKTEMCSRAFLYPEVFFLLP